MPPLLLFHAIAPPYPGGTPVILHRVLSGLFPPDVITFTDVRQRSAVRAGSERALAGEYRYFLRIPPWNRLAIYRWPFGIANALLAVAAGVRAGLAGRRRGVGWVLSVADEGFSPIGGAVAARIAGVPHLIWVFDLWEENLLTDVDGWIASLAERPIWKGARAILSHTPKMADHYGRKYGIEVDVLPTPIALPPGATDDPTPASGREAAPPFEVLSGGAVYWAQDEALGRLARVCSGDGDLRLTLIGDERALREKGIVADAYEDSLPQADFQRRVREADVLFLGLSFDSVAPDIIRTATPARLVDYMASGRPLLIHAPADSHVAAYAREEDFAEVVDMPDEAALAAGLRAVVSDPERSTMRARRAQRLVAERHELGRIRAGLLSILNETRS